MPTHDIHSSPGTTSHQLPELPVGWHYADDVVLDDSRASRGRRRLWLLAVVAVAVAACVVGLLVFNAAGHYSRGVAALQEKSYEQAAAEFSAARLLVFPYRDAHVREEQAQLALTVQMAEADEAQVRVERVSGALDEAAAALGARDSGGVLAALEAVRPGDLRAGLRDSIEARQAAAALGEDLTAAARLALQQPEVGPRRPVRRGAPGSRPIGARGAALADKATTGRQLSVRLGAARDAAQRGQWREALRLALAVTAAQQGFPGAAALVADARQALTPKPSPTPAATPAAPAAPAASTGGSSSGSTSQPPPP